MILQVLIAMVAGWVQRHQQQVISYVIEENRVLKAQLGGRERNVQNFSYRPQDIDTYKFMKCGMTRFFQARF
jgi:hypothetical protein